MTRFPGDDPAADAVADVFLDVPYAVARPDGPAADYRATATLPFRVELARQLRRRRTHFVGLLMVVLPVILVVAFRIGGDNAGPTTSGFIDLAQSSAANFVMVTLFFSASFLLTVVVALFFGDTIAAEASWSSLKYLLAIPIPRHRLLRQKLLVAVVLTVAAVAVLVVSATAVGALSYGTGALSTPTGASFTGAQVVWRIGLVAGYLTLGLAWVAGVAFLMTVVTDVPLGAVGTAVLLMILSQILDQITALGAVRNWLPTHYAFAWTGALVDPVDMMEMFRGAATSVGYAAVAVTAAFVLFRRKDITS